MKYRQSPKLKFVFLLFNTFALYFFVLLAQIEAADHTSNHGDPSQSILQELGLLKAPYLTVQYYSVKGETPAAIREELNKSGPVDLSGFRRDAFVQWYIRWNWPSRSDGRPDFSRTMLSCNIKLFFPSWQPVGEPSQELRDKWLKFIRALASHEKVHIDNIIGNLTLISAAINWAFKNLLNLDASTANQIAGAVLAYMREQDKIFDRLTKHGLTQGVKFP